MLVRYGLWAVEFATNRSFAYRSAIDYISKDRLSKDRLGGTIKAALETWKRKRAEEWLKRKDNDKAEKVVRIGFKDRGGKLMFFTLSEF